MSSADLEQPDMYEPAQADPAGAVDVTHVVSYVDGTIDMLETSKRVGGFFFIQFAVFYALASTFLFVPSILAFLYSNSWQHLIVRPPVELPSAPILGSPVSLPVDHRHVD
jgi:hypothetical protein